MLSLSTPIFDLIFKEVKSSIQPCSGWTCMLPISSECPFLGPLRVTHKAYILSLPSSGSFTVLVFQRPQTTWRASDLPKYLETISWNDSLGSLRLCSLMCSQSLRAKRQQCICRGCCEFRCFDFHSSAWTQCTQSHKLNYPENLKPVSSRR